MIEVQVGDAAGSVTASATETEDARGIICVFYFADKDLPSRTDEGDATLVDTRSPTSTTK